MVYNNIAPASTSTVALKHFTADSREESKDSALPLRAPISDLTAHLDRQKGHSIIDAEVGSVTESESESSFTRSAQLLSTSMPSTDLAWSMGRLMLDPRSADVILFLSLERGNFCCR